ncbi:flavin reductase family protein [Glacieibacterium sp.]|uniref:flavin reductase family protein n=1 Tax=Glacieibacterium sp. TaxID=2860237 RepID=UPI003B00F7C7
MDHVSPDIDQRALRDAFGAFATGVTIVAGHGPDGTRVGLTANSFTSVSLDPPLLLVCPARGASALPALRTAGRFAVNVLTLDQQEIADRFAKRGIDRFAVGGWSEWHGVPVLDDAMASFVCDLHAELDGGDHAILVGRVLALRSHPEAEPLLYLRGRYRQMHVPR